MLKLLSILYNMLIVMSIAEELEAVERERARRRMLATQNNKSGKAIAAVETFPPQELGKTRDKVAAAVGLGRDGILGSWRLSSNIKLPLQECL